MTVRVEEEQQREHGDGEDQIEADVGDRAEERDRTGVAACADGGQHLAQVREWQGRADRQEDPSRPVPGLCRHDQRADRHPAQAREEHRDQADHRARLALAEARTVGDQRLRLFPDLLDAIRRGVADDDDRCGRRVGWGGCSERECGHRSAGAQHDRDDRDRASGASARGRPVATRGVGCHGCLHAAMVAPASPQSQGENATSSPGASTPANRGGGRVVLAGQGAYGEIADNPRR